MNILAFGNIGLFFEYDSISVQLPVNPEKLTITYKGNNKNVEIIQLGEISIPKKKKLGTIKFQSFFPYENWWTGVNTKRRFESVEFYKDFFTRIMDEAKPCRFVVTGTNFNTLVTVENFEYYNQGGDYEDCYYSLELKEYVPYHVKILTPTLTTGYSSDNTELPVIGSMDTPTLLPEQITVGCSVVVNGNVYTASTGDITNATKSDFKCKVDFIKKNASCKYHVTSENGEWVGWVKDSDITLA